MRSCETHFVDGTDFYTTKMPILKVDLLCNMSVIRTYLVKDLASVTEELMNTLYKSDWESETNVENEDFLFRQIETMHLKIMQDSEITQYNKGSSTIISIANRLFAIQNSLIGSAQPVSDTVTVRSCILRTQTLIGDLRNVDSSTCIVC